MPHGIECRNSAGAVTLNIERLAKRYATGAFSVGVASSTNVIVPGISPTHNFMVSLFRAGQPVWPNQIVITVYAGYINFRNLSQYYGGAFTYLVIKV